METKQTYQESLTSGTTKSILQISNSRQKDSNTPSKKSKESESNPLVESVSGYEIPYLGANSMIAHSISIVLLNVPEEVSNFAKTQCLFISLDYKKHSGVCSKLPFHPGVICSPALWLIELSENIPYKSSSRYRKYCQHYLRHVVAHELAHAYLNHGGNDLEDKEVELADELAADQLAGKWGFQRPY